jgi:hypothetical protein
MKKFNKYFGGEYIKYWYVAFFIVILIMVFDSYNDRTVTAYKLTIYDNNGNNVETTIISRQELLSSNLRLPLTKSFEPIKKF